MRATLLSRLISAAAVSLAVGTGAAQESPQVELEVGWSSGQGMVSAQSHVRVEEIGREIARLESIKARVFKGKIGPCAKRLSFKYSTSTLREVNYYFVGNAMIKLNPGSDRSGRFHVFQRGEFPWLEGFLGQVKPSGICGK